MLLSSPIPCRWHRRSRCWIDASHDAPPRPPDSPLFEIKDAVHNSGNPHFFFLPPIVPDPSASFTEEPFDGSVEVDVHICIWKLEEAECGPSLDIYNVNTGPGSETVRVSTGEEYYIVNWHTDRILVDPDLHLAEGEVYRIRVMAGAHELGHADVTVVSSGKELKNVDTDEFIPLKDGRTLPIKFRIEEGALGYTNPYISTGSYHTCAVAAGGKAYCWGSNRWRQLGIGWGSPERVNTPQEVHGGHTWRAVTTGMFHSCGVTVEDKLYCWGGGTFGQLGIGGYPYMQPTPAEVQGFSFQSVMAKQWRSCGLTIDGDWHCWGSNWYAELGTGSRDPIRHPTPQAVAVGSFETLALGGNHTCGLTATGELYCWGYNYYGQLGTGFPTTDPPPYALPTAQLVGTGYQAPALGEWHTCALKSTSPDLYCWGYNEFGETGSGAYTDAEPTPLMVTDNHAWQAVAAGVHHTCGLTIDGDWYCWGNNWFAQLGIGSYSWGHANPQLVTVGSFESVSPGFMHTCGVAPDGNAYCWGYNSDGQLGDGTFNSSVTARLVLDLDPSVP
jgi:alpha-tubulin suppressor-like RCC1 family protein